jgi:hypothetical protein
MFIFFDARMSFARTLTVLLFMFCTGFAETTENDVCDFDDSLAILLIRSVQSHTSHSEVLDYILQDSLSVNHEICKDEYKVQAISAKVTSLYNTSKTAKNVKAYDIAYTKYEHFSGNEEDGKTFSDEDNAVFNIVLDYIVAKYDKHFANVKRNMLSEALSGKKSIYGFKSKLDALLDELQVSKISMVEGVPSAELQSQWEHSWAGLWITDVPPLKKYNENNYEWLQTPSRNFITKYPESPYTPVLRALFNDTLMQELVNNEEKQEIQLYKEDNRHLAFGLGFLVGKPLLGDGLEAEKATYSAAIPQGRLQIHHFVAQVQCDMYYHNGLKAVGLNGHLGYNLEFGDYGLDLLTGIGMEQFLEDKDSTVYKAYSFGLQGYKRFFFTGFGAIAPRIQWTLKTFKYKSPETGRRRRVYINQFYIGATFEVVVPFSEIH